jgi:hypothetical protein
MPDFSASFVEHHEHRLHALVGLAHHIAGRRFESHLTGGRGVHAHFVCEAGTMEVVLGTVLVEFRNDECTQAVGPLGGVGESGEHEMQDVVGQIVLATSDPNFVAVDRVGAVVSGFGTGSDHPEVRSALRFG